jgi:hypothetical protein
MEKTVPKRRLHSSAYVVMWLVGVVIVALLLGVIAFVKFTNTPNEAPATSGGLWFYAKI